MFPPMRARLAMAVLAAALTIPGCSVFKPKDPLSKVPDEGGTFVLDDTGRGERPQPDGGSDELSPLEAMMPWNWCR